MPSPSLKVWDRAIGDLADVRSSATRADEENAVTARFGFTEDELHEYRDVFDDFDLDGSGGIDTHELRLVMEKLGEPVTEERLAELIAEVDEDRSGTIEFPEFLTVVDQIRKGAEDTGMMKVVKMAQSFHSNRAKEAMQRRITRIDSLREVYKEAGFAPDETVTKHERVAMYNTMKHAMDGYLTKFTGDARYHACAELRDRRNKVTREFEQEVCDTQVAEQQEQRRQMLEASAKILGQTRDNWRKHRHAMKEACDGSRRDQLNDHAIKVEVLERDIAHAHVPPPKYSRTLLDMKKAEKELVRQERFEEAAEERRREDILRRKEDAAHVAWLEHERNLQRNAQRKRFAFEEEQHESKSKAALWSTRRQAELDMKTTRWRMGNNKEDARHAHAMDRIDTRRFLKQTLGQLRPCVAKRPGHSSTSASLRGTQMHNATAEGKAAVSSLTSIHNFLDTHAVEIDAEEARQLDSTARRAATTFGLKQGQLGGTI
eukprot:g4446.t1